MLKSLTMTNKPVVTRCQVLESMTAFYFLGDERGQGFGSGLWDHKGLSYDLVNWTTKCKKLNLQLEVVN